MKADLTPSRHADLLYSHDPMGQAAIETATEIEAAMGLFSGKTEATLPVGLSQTHVRKVLRVLFIDDEESNKAEALRQQGYNVFHRNDVTDISELERQEYHLIFCDIQGVGKEVSDDEGAGLIRLIKEKLRYPVVIAYSAFSYQPG